MNKKIIHTFECCYNSALKYKTRTEWRKNERSHIKAAKINNYIDKCTAHMPKGYKEDCKKKWTNENILKEALKYKTRKEWHKSSPVSYDLAVQNRLYKECVKHMINLKPQLTEKQIIESALKYKRRGDWCIYHRSAYMKAKRINIFEQCTKHMKPWKGDKNE